LQHKYCCNLQWETSVSWRIFSRPPPRPAREPARCRRTGICHA